MNLDLFDLIVLKNSSVSGSIITTTQELLFPKIKESWSHCGLIITHPLLDYLDIKYKKTDTYIIESTISGTLFDNIHDIYSNSTNGIQIRSLNEFLDNDIETGVYKLKNKIILTDELKIKVKDYYLKVKDYKYNFNFSLMIKNLLPIFIRDQLFKEKQIESSFFCSQFCLEFYKLLNIINKETKSEFIPPNLFIKNFNHLFDNLIYIK
jgi:hypothetical protein